MFPLPFPPGHILARAADNATVLLKWVLTSDGEGPSSGEQIKESQPGGWSPNGRRRHKEHGGGAGGARSPHRVPPVQFQRTGPRAAQVGVRGLDSMSLRTARASSAMRVRPAASI